jgi:Tfp pilus assembly protein PilF
MDRWKVGAVLALPLAAFVGCAGTARAATLAELDAVSRASDQSGTGIALARKQIAAGELLDARATLERVILNHPDNDDARLLHARLLCRLDDMDGARLEFEALRGHRISPAPLGEGGLACPGDGGN